MSFDASTASHSSGTTMEKAFSRAGVKSPEKQAMEMLDRHWQRHKPDLLRTLRSFHQELLEICPPVILALVGGEDWLGTLARTFAYSKKRGHADMKRECASQNAKRSAKAQYANHVYSTNPHTIYSREQKYKRGGATPAADLIAPDENNPGWKTRNGSSLAVSREIARNIAVRQRRGIVRVKVDIDPRNKTAILASTLPLQLRGLLINGLPITDVTKEAALAWCETRQKQTALVERWCSLVADPRKTLGEQLTQEIVAELVRAAE